MDLFYWCDGCAQNLNAATCGHNIMSIDNGALTMQLCDECNKSLVAEELGELSRELYEAISETRKNAT